MEQVSGKSVYVGLSGGVDSAVSAALLQRAGAKATGVFIKGWYPPGMPCTWAEDRRDAMRVAARLGIPFITLDASAEYKKSVIDYLLAEYAAGRTPNPDIMCNREVKFGAFWRFARDRDADFIATGHYARVERDAGGARLLRGADEAKDQSYFLWAVPKDVIARTILPLGGMKKTNVRALAARFDLPVAEKRDSQGICFLGSVSVEDFLRSELDVKSGSAIDETGAVVGEHDGAVLYTLGERVALRNAPPGPWYVVGKDAVANTLSVDTRPKDAVPQKGSITLTEANWFDADRPALLSAQYRYHGPIISGTLSDDRRTFTLNESLPEPLAEGQSLVLYDGDRIMGGGIIS